MVDRDYMRGGPGPGGGMQLAMPRLTPVIRWLLLANAGLFLLNYIPSIGAWLFSWFALDSAEPLLFPLQAFTYQFLHGFPGLGHIFMNMLVLYFFGTAVESWIGPVRFLRLYLGAGVAGAAGFLLFSLVRGGGTCIGASGAVSGVVLYFCCVQPRATVILLFIPVRAWVLGVGWVFLAAHHLYVDLSRGVGDDVAHSAHLGGALYGFFFWRYQGLVERWLERLARRRLDRQRRSEEADRERMDALLDKVNRLGLHSLSEGERRFLQDMSRRFKRR